MDSVALFETGSSFLVAWGLERQVHQVDEEEKVEDDGGRAQPHGNEECTQKLGTGPTCWLSQDRVWPFLKWLCSGHPLHSLISGGFLASNLSSLLLF